MFAVFEVIGVYVYVLAVDLVHRIRRKVKYGNGAGHSRDPPVIIIIIIMIVVIIIVVVVVVVVIIVTTHNYSRGPDCERVLSYRSVLLC